MREIHNVLNQLLDQNPALHAAWFDDPQNPSALHVVSSIEPTSQILLLPTNLRNLELHQHLSQRINTLRTPATGARATNANQVCQNEPISLGTQIQPHGANWLGTAGAPVSFLDADNRICWGILSNWHVLADGGMQIGRTAHQPDTTKPAIGRLARWAQPLPDEDNLIDAALADCLIDGNHTIADTILGVGIIGPQPRDATIDLEVIKSGRTTGVTLGTCIGTAAAVSVSYGTFTARFIDQDIFAADSGSFSAPGDSGSAILDRANWSLTSLLFAGSDTITVGNPIRHVTQAMSLLFPFN